MRRADLITSHVADATQAVAEREGAASWSAGKALFFYSIVAVQACAWLLLLALAALAILACADVRAYAAPPEQRERLAMLREEFMHKAGFQDWIAAWWDRLNVEDRRLLLALCGLDESEENARRAWKLHLQDSRDKLVFELKRIGRLIEGLKWA